MSVGTLVRHVSFHSISWENYLMSQKKKKKKKKKKLLETSKDYNSAIKCLKETQLIAPTFFIVAGVDDEGTVITRSRHKFEKYK